MKSQGKDPNQSLQDQYDWVVFGDHPGVLLNACLVARLGLSVLHVPIGQTQSSFITPTGDYYDADPNYFLGFNRHHPADGLTSFCLSHIGIWAECCDLLLHEPPVLQVLTPSFRFELFSESAVLSAELEREFGKKFSAELGLSYGLSLFRKESFLFWNELINRLTLQTGRIPSKSKGTPFSQVNDRVVRRLKEMVSPQSSRLLQKLKKNNFLDKSDELTWALKALWEQMIAGSVNEELLRWSDVLHALSLSGSAVSFQGGVNAYRELLKRAAQKTGVYCVPSDEWDCRKILLERGRFTGLELVGPLFPKGKKISVRGGAFGCALHRIPLLLSDRFSSSWMYQIGKKLKKIEKNTTPLSWRFTLTVTVDQEALPFERRSRWVWQEPGAPSLECEVVQSFPSDAALSSSSQVSMQIRTWLPYRSESLQKEFLETTAQRMFRKVQELLPFVELHVQSKWFPEFKLLTDIPDHLLMFDSHQQSDSQIAEGLFYIASDSYPHLGSFGSTVAAIEATGWLAHRSGLAGPFS